MKNVKRLTTLAVASFALVGASFTIASPAYANGTSAISGATVFSDSTVTSATPRSANVQLRAGNTVKQIAAGSQDSAGQ
jgi:hypothetical protein